MTLGPIAFLSPWLLAGLLALPVIWWLLRTVPPRPQRIEFPPTRILVGIDNREKTPAKTPWWLTLIRMLAAALVILALAEPVLNPNRETALTGSGPVVLVVDNGWASAAHWSARTSMVTRLIAEAEGQSRPVMVVPTAHAGRSIAAKAEAPAAARSTAAAMQPQPFAPDRTAAVQAIANALGGATNASVVWLADGIDHDDTTRAFADRLKAVAGSGFAVVDVRPGLEALGHQRHGDDRRPARGAGAARGRQGPRRYSARHVGARAAAGRGALHPQRGRDARHCQLRSAARAQEPGHPHRDRRRALGGRGASARCALAVAPRRPLFERIPGAGAAAARSALLHRARVGALHRDRPGRRREPDRCRRLHHEAQRVRAHAGRHRRAAARRPRAHRRMGEEGRRAGALCRAAARKGRRRSAPGGSADRRTHARRRAVVVDAAAAGAVRR